jgi:hypothetical protein
MLQGDRATRPVPLFGVTLALGLVAGASVSLIAFYLARYGPEGDGWSFRGNGALQALTLIPPFLTAGWTALVLRCRSHPAWLGLGLGAGAVGLILAAIGASLLPILGELGDIVAGGITLVALAAWTLVAPAIATTFPKSSAGPPRAVALHVLAGAALLAAIIAGLIVTEMVFPPGS